MKGLGLLAVAATLASCGSGKDDGARPPVLICQGCNVDLGEVRIGEDGTSKLTVVNAGTSPVDITEFNEDLTPFATSLACRSRGDCRQHTVPAHESLDVGFTFHPHDKGEVDYTIAFASSAGPISVHLKGVGVATDVLCSPAELDFGGLLQGTSLTKSVTCENRSDLAAVLVVEPIANGTHEFTVNAGQLTLDSFASFELPVTFSAGPLPDEMASSEAFGTVRIHDGAGAVVDTILATGTVLRSFLGVYPPPMAAYDFGFVLPGAGAATKVLTLSNSGGQALTITALDIASGSDPEFAVSAPKPAPFQIPSHGEVEIGLTFDPPAGDEGPRAGRLHIESDDPGGPTIFYGLSGFAGAAPDVSCTWEGAPGALDLGATPVGSSATRDIVCTDSSPSDDPSTDLDNLRLVWWGMLQPPGAFQLSVPGGASSTGYRAGESFTVVVQYSPQSRENSDSGLVVLETNAPEHPELDIPVTGRPGP